MGARAIGGNNMAANQEGRILSLHVCVGHLEPMKDADNVEVITGFGIEGDRMPRSTRHAGDGRCC